MSFPYDGHPHVTAWEAVGSRVTCDPPPTDTDEDYLVLVGDRKFYITLINDDFGLAGSAVEDPTRAHASQFGSFARGRLNLIVTTSPDFYERFLAASSVARRLNLLDKADRIAVFQAVLYGNPARPRSEGEIAGIRDEIDDLFLGMP